MKRKINIVWKEKKGRSRRNRMILIHSNVSNLMILTHSTVSKFFKKQHTNTLYCFSNTDVVWMRAVTVADQIFKMNTS